jgi:LuxR family transcriptional regulator, maltose regulon positive regulatory protein
VTLEAALLGVAVALAAGEPVDALADTVLDVAEPEGFLFALPEAGLPVFDAVRSRARRRPRTPFLDLLARTPPHRALVRPTIAYTGDALTHRERIVLHHLATALTYREIADELYVSVNTVKSHARHVIRKLHASTRAEAIARARELHYL